MDDINHSNQIDEAVLDELIEQQVKMEEEWQAKQVITPIRFNCSVKQCVIPAIQGYTEKTITLEGVKITV